MRFKIFSSGSVVAGALLLSVGVVVGCSDDPGLSRSDVAEVVREELSQVPAPQPGLTKSDVTEIVENALENAVAGLEVGITPSDAAEIARLAVASIPPRASEAEYTKFFVDSAISRYRAEGLQATLDHYNDPRNVDGQWYVFIIAEDDTVIGHHDPNLLGLDLKGAVGTDANGYEFGTEMLSAAEDGKWVSYVYRNPETASAGSISFDDLELKNAWVVRHDGLLFGSGWYINADAFTQSLIATMVDKFRQLGLDGVIEYFDSDDSARAGLADTVDYYNNAENLTGEWFGFIADTNGTFILHSDPAMLGKDITDLFGEEPIEATQDGNWITTGDSDSSTPTPLSIRAWVIDYRGMTFGAGWYDNTN